MKRSRRDVSTTVEMELSPLEGRHGDLDPRVHGEQH